MMLLTIARLVDLAHPRRHRIQARALTVGAIGGGVCDIVLSDPSVSPIHARIELGDGGIIVEDLGSTNGTRVNGAKVIGRVVAREGDLILVGETVLRFSTPDRAPTRLPPGVEEELLAALSANPADDAARMVYADWLEQHDRVPKAELIRLELARDGESPGDRPEADARRRALYPIVGQDWRATVSRAGIEKCGVELEVACPKRWSSLAPTADPMTRHCGACEREVHYCVDLEAVRRRGRERACVAFDAGLVRVEAEEAYAPRFVMGMLKI